jgi:hypothetical protein
MENSTRSPLLVYNGILTAANPHVSPAPANASGSAPGAHRSRHGIHQRLRRCWPATTCAPLSKPSNGLPAPLPPPTATSKMSSACQPLRLWIARRHVHSALGPTTHPTAIPHALPSPALGCSSPILSPCAAPLLPGAPPCRLVYPFICFNLASGSCGEPLSGRPTPTW